MGVAMNMSSYEIERDNALETEYGAEVLYAGWNPVLSLSCQQYEPEELDRTKSITPYLATVDVEVFLKKMYACQR